MDVIADNTGILRCILLSQQSGYYSGQYIAHTAAGHCRVTGRVEVKFLVGSNSYRIVVFEYDIHAMFFCPLPARLQTLPPILVFAEQAVELFNMRGKYGTFWHMLP